MNSVEPFHILLVDDDELVHRTATIEFSGDEYDDLIFSSVYSGEEALEAISKEPSKYSVILLDFQMGDGKLDGGDTAKKILKINPNQFILTFSGDSSREALKKTFKSGVVEFLEKTISTKEKVEVIRQYCHKYRKFFESTSPKAIVEKKKEAFELVELIGRSDSLFEVAKDVLLYSSHDSNVLIRGETGVGKELIAKGIHGNSNRRNHPFIAVNCAAIPENLIESELFGHGKGSFTGAISDKKGKFEEANNGTIFLDEIGDMPQAVQVKLQAGHIHY